jgi:solute carrier family 25 folate transporter 32
MAVVRLSRLLQRYASVDPGYRTNVIAIPLFHSLFFPIYEHTKKQMAASGHRKETACLAATITAGGICNFVTNPIWIVRTRLMAQYLHPKTNQYATASPLGVMREMYEKVGLRV